MNFDEALRHMQEGNASEEEKAYVQSKLDEANKHVDALDSQNTKSPRSEKKNRENGKKKGLITAVVIVAVIVVALGAIFAGVFGSATASANKAAVVDRTEAAQLAKAYAFSLTQDSSMKLPLVTSPSDLVVRDIDRGLKYVASKPSASYFEYEVKLVGMGIEIEVVVDSRTKQCHIGDIDRD